MQLKIMDENIEFELIKNTGNSDVLLGINIKDSIYEEDIMTISITLDKEEFKQLQELVK